MPDMKKLIVGDKEFDIVDQAAQDHLLEHDQQIEQILDNNIVNKNMLINSDFICNFFDDADLNKSGWSFSATSDAKPQLIGAMGLQIIPPCTGVEIVTPYWHPSWSVTQGVPSIDFPITVSVEYAYNNLNPDTLKVASVTYSDNTRTSELVNIAELEEGKYLQIKLTNGGTANVCRSVFTLSDQLTKPLYIRRIKIERSEIATGFDQAMNDLALLKVVKDMMNEVVGSKNLYSNTIYQNDIGQYIVLNDSVTKFRFLRVLVYINDLSYTNGTTFLFANLKNQIQVQHIPICINGTLGSVRVETTMQGGNQTIHIFSTTFGSTMFITKVDGIY